MKQEWQIFFEDTLIQKFQELRQKNHRLSVRSFAIKASISPSSISRILSKMNWSLTLESAIQVFRKLRLDSDTINHLVVLATPLCTDVSEQILVEDLKQEFLTDPHYIPVLLSFGLQPCPSIEQIAHALKLPFSQVSIIVEELISMGHLELGPDGKIVPASEKKLKTGDGPTSEVIRKHHLANFDVLREALINGRTEDRDITSLTFTGDSTQIQNVQKEIRQFYQRVLAIMNHTASKDEIFKIVVGFMPLDLQAALKEENELRF